MRCRRYLSKFESRIAYSVGGLILRDEEESKARQFRSLLLTGLAFLKGERSLEIFISKGKFLRRKYLKEIKKSVSTAEVIIFEGPWQYRLVKNFVMGKKIIYDAHNVEGSLRKGNKWEAYVQELEQELIQASDLIITVSHEDSSFLVNKFGLGEKKVVCIPEGFETPTQKWNGTNSNEIVFIGSAYLPNVEAVELLLKVAINLPHYQFKIIGSVSHAISKKSLPSNVKLLGELGGESKDREMVHSLLAINPVSKGSGRNLKMNDYISLGIPIVTTEVGARGFDDTLKQHMTLSKIETFAASIEEAAHDTEKLENDSKFFMEYSQKNSYENTTRSTFEIISSLLDC